jgi:hypothetical protein
MSIKFLSKKTLADQRALKFKVFRAAEEDKLIIQILIY